MTDNLMQGKAAITPVVASAAKPLSPNDGELSEEDPEIAAPVLIRIVLLSL